MNKAIELDPDLAFGYFTRALVYYSLADYKSELADYATAISLDPENPDTYYNRGLTLAELGRVAEAKADFDRALDLGHDPDTIEKELSALP